MPSAPTNPKTKPIHHEYPYLHSDCLSRYLNHNVRMVDFQMAQTGQERATTACRGRASKQQIIVEQTRNRQLKQEMTNNIAHELKTPVSSIRGYLEILMGDKPVTDEQRKYFIERCYNQTLRLSDLINDVISSNSP